MPTVLITASKARTCGRQPMDMELTNLHFLNCITVTTTRQWVLTTKLNLRLLGTKSTGAWVYLPTRLNSRVWWRLTQTCLLGSCMRLCPTTSACSLRGALVFCAWSDNRMKHKKHLHSVKATLVVAVVASRIEQERKIGTCLARRSKLWTLFLNVIRPHICQAPEVTKQG
jgi:hypothetical protein